MCDASRFPYGPSVYRPAATYTPLTDAEIAAMRVDFLDRWQRALPQARVAVRELVAQITGGTHAGPH